MPRALQAPPPGHSIRWWLLIVGAALIVASFIVLVLYPWSGSLLAYLVGALLVIAVIIGIVLLLRWAFNFVAVRGYRMRQGRVPQP